MFQARQSRRFTKRVENLKESLNEFGNNLVQLNSDLKDYNEGLSDSVKDADGRKEQRLLAETDRIEDIMDQVEDIAIGIQLDLRQPIDLSED